MENQRTQKDLESIRHLMERSVKFISLSGLSGILAGVYALIGAGLAYFQIYGQDPIRSNSYYRQDPKLVFNLFLIAIVVLMASLFTGWWYSFRKAKKYNTTIWNETGKRLLVNLALPLIVGGTFTLVLVYHEHYNVVAASTLIFYGFALVHASPNLYDEVRYLGYCEMMVGLIAAILPGFGLLFWALGFGALHILYGGMMYKKYDR
jgi:formate/nitrite transporter FocA (FNT family)